MTHPNRPERIPCVYIMASRPGGALYVGAPSNGGEIPAYAGMTVGGGNDGWGAGMTVGGGHDGKGACAPSNGGGIPAYAGMTVRGTGMMGMGEGE